MTIQTRIDELSKELQELNRQKENLDFFKENNFTSLLDVADELESKHEVLHDVIQAVIDNQLEKNPKQMDDREKEIWFASTLSKMIKINQIMGGVISEIEKMGKE